MKSVIFAFRFQLCSPSRFLRAQRDGRDSAASPIPPFGARDAWRVGELGDKLGDKRGRGKLMSFGGFPGQLSSVSDGARDDEYADFKEGVFGKVRSESFRDNDGGGSKNSS